jgi:hypothetical protein
MLVFFALSCKEIQGPAGPPGPPGDGTGSLTDPSIMPKVLYTYPPANSQGPYTDFSTPTMQIRFNKIMDRASLKRALSLTSPMTTVWIDTQSVSSVTGDVFNMYPSDSGSTSYDFHWKLGGVYTLSVAGSAKDINGNHLTSYSMTFVPEPHFRVTQVYPRDGTINVGLQYPYLYLYFNSPVDTAIASHIHISPSIAGNWDYPYYYGYYGNGPDSTELVFRTSATLNENTQYEITISPAAHDKLGNPLTRAFTSSFTTVAFKVIYTDPSNGGALYRLTNSVYVNFTHPLDTSTVRRSFHIQPFVDGSIDSYPGSTSFSFHPASEFPPESAFLATIDTSIRSSDGAALSAPFNFSFKSPAFQVTRSYPSDGSTEVSRDLYEISVGFSSVIDTGSIRTSFSAPGLSGN